MLSLSHPLMVVAAALCAAAPAIAQISGPAPVNLAPNSQWEVITGFSHGVRENPSGTGREAPIAVFAHTTHCNICTATVRGSTGDLKAGDLVTFNGPGVDARLKLSPMRVLAVTRDASFTFALPLGLEPAVSAPATVLNINIGMAASTHTGDGPDGWSKSPSLEIWREDNAANVPAGADYSLGVRKTSADRQQLVTRPRPGRFHGRMIVFGAYVYQRVRGGAGSWRITLASNGAGGREVFSAQAPATPGWQWLEASYAVPLDATEVSAGVVFDGQVDDVYYVANPVLTFGTAIGVNNYLKPTTEIVIPRVKLTPITWNNAVVTFPRSPGAGEGYGFSWDVYAETGGGIAPTVAAVGVALEGIDDNPVVANSGVVRSIAFRSAVTAPTLYSEILGQTVAGVKSFAGPTITLDGTGRAWAYSGVAADSWRNVSMDMGSYVLK
jgi:hypothetical protein